MGQRVHERDNSPCEKGLGKIPHPSNYVRTQPQDADEETENRPQQTRFFNSNPNGPRKDFCKEKSKEVNA